MTIDADTRARSGRHRSDWRATLPIPRVAAVAGNIKVGNRRNLLTRWQALEYIVSQNLERRAMALLNCIFVVPGAIGDMACCSHCAKPAASPRDTLAEDADLTLRVLRLGYEIEYDQRAIAFTEAPGYGCPV